MSKFIAIVQNINISKETQFAAVNMITVTVRGLLNLGKLKEIKDKILNIAIILIESLFI